MPMITVTVRDVAYSVDEDILRALTASYDVWRDGLGKFSGAMGREAFLRGTSDIVMRSVRPEPSDPWKAERYLRVLRHTLSSRPRSAVTGQRRDKKIVVP